eukprot:TRINITY_DN2259_c0_g1_i1.p1 TRINITY_DN2259_c0_g1~~TRINITY_DN2259_c0_g1_i1.p1  ORF type:complete len:703 (+),score=297.14 TRINITY_DN2259_c0_g1_i1:49-2157(+)
MGKGKACGCCESGPPTVQTFASDGRQPEEMGLPETITIENPARRVINSDCPVCIVFVAFWIGMFIVASLAFEKGDAEKLIYGTDYLDQKCGQGAAPAGWEVAVAAHRAADPATYAYQTENWSDNKYLFIPLPYNDNNPLDGSTWTDFDPTTALASGVCVSACPDSGLTSIDALTDPPFKVFTYGSREGVNPPETYTVWYNSYDVLRRCLPSSNNTAAESISFLADAMDDVPEVTRITNFFTRGLADIEEAYMVLVFCGMLSIILPFLYTILLRCILKPLVWIMLLLVLVILIGSGYLAYTRYDDLDNDNDSTNDNDAKAFLALAIVTWIMAALYACFLVWFCKHINTACEIIQQAGKVLTSDPSILLIPIFTGVMLLALFVFIIYVVLHVWTMEDGENIVATGGQIGGINTTVVVPDDYATRNNLLYYVFFGWLWTMGLISALGYFVVSAVTVQWYYSHKDDDEKKVRCFVGWLRGYAWAFLYHMGCLITGALLVAIIQFIRFILQKVTDKFKQSSDAAKCIMCCVDCCLAYVERFLQYISRNAYIMTAIEGSGFWCSCCKVVGVLLGAISYLAPLIIVSDVVFFVGKLFLVSGTVAAGYFMLYDQDLAPDVDDGILVLVVIGIIAYVVASLFMSVYESAIDSMFVLVFHETRQPKDPSLYFCPQDVFQSVTGKSKTQASMFKQEHAAKVAAADGTEPSAAV